jgi:hypothetical protein
LIAGEFVQDGPDRLGREPLAARFLQAGVLLDVVSDDLRLVEEISSLLGPAVRPSAAAPAIAARFTTIEGTGLLRLTMPRAEHLEPTDLLLAATSPDFPFDVTSSAPGRVVLALRGERAAALEVSGSDCRFALREGWRKAVALLLLQRLMRSREDAIFFHAASASLRGGGVMLIGPKGAGKSTLALALASRGHALLGDENACYLPATRMLVPFRRPVGVKPGPRSLHVDAALSARGRSPERDGMMRVPVQELFPGEEPAPVPLRALVFLEGLAAHPALRRLDPGRAELARLQPVGSSMLNAAHTRRVFEMARLLAQCATWALAAGAPDATAEALEEALAA